MAQVGQPPEKSRKREIAEAVGEALVASVPVAGGALAVLPLDPLAIPHVAVFVIGHGT